MSPAEGLTEPQPSPSWRGRWSEQSSPAILLIQLVPGSQRELCQIQRPPRKTARGPLPRPLLFKYLGQVLCASVPPVWKWKLRHKGSTGPHSRLSLLSSLTGCVCCSLRPPTQSASGEGPGTWAQRPPRLQGSPRPVPAHARAKPALPARQKVALCGRRSGPREGTAGTCQIRGEPSLLRGTE